MCERTTAALLQIRVGEADLARVVRIRDRLHLSRYILVDEPYCTILPQARLECISRLGRRLAIVVLQGHRLPLNDDTLLYNGRVRQSTPAIILHLVPRT